MIDTLNNSVELTHAGIKIPHGYYFYPDRNIFFCNIPKCATTTINNYILRSPELILDEPFYFTVMRDPIERLKSALWMICNISTDHSIVSYCPQCGYILKEFNIESFVKEIKNIEHSDIDRDLLIHAFPQTCFINNSTYAEQELKIYRLDQVNDIFDTKLLKENSNGSDSNPKRYKIFQKHFDEQYITYSRFLKNYYIDDFKLWDSINT